MHPCLPLVCLAPLGAGLAQVPTNDRLQALERELARLSAELGALRLERDTQTQRVAELEARQQALSQELAGAQPRSGGWPERLTLGGYGEIHFSRVEGPGGEQIDNERFVAYLGYRFSDSIELHSEVELEHAFVEDGQGEISLEQLHVDFRLSDRLTVRAGRFLTPLGILNQTHEPTTFHGVERPLFETVVIPTTWSTDGAGVLGDLAEDLRYQLYVGSSLNGTGFDPIEGIREGRQESSPGLSQPAISGRLDWGAWRSEAGSLRCAPWFFGGGLDNGNAGVNPGLDADLWIAGFDVQASLGDFDLRAAYAYEKIQGAQDIGGNVASAIDGYCAETAWHAWRSQVGTEEAQDLAFFVRYDKVDTQKEMPEGVSPDPRGRRDEITLGASYFPVRDLVIKADYQFRDDQAGGLPEQFNLGLGWSF